MASDTKAVSGNRWRMAAWGIAVLVLTLPFVAMKFTSEVDWTASDFMFAGILIGSVGLVYGLTVRATRNRAHRAGIVLALAATFLTIWATGAVGMIGDERDPMNLIFAAVLLIALTGAALAGFRAPGMARAMLIAAAAQLLASIIGMFGDPLGGAFSALFAAIWLASAWMFRNAGRQQPMAA